MSNSVTVTEFFSGKYFEIPKYQRGYSWEEKQIWDFFDDISETIDAGTPHYIGTIVLSPVGGEKGKYYLIDGQQRVTTITMIIDAISDSLDKEDAAFYRRNFIKSDDRYKLLPLNRDREFFEAIIDGDPGDPKNKSQRLLAKGYLAIKTRVNSLPDKKAVLNALISMELLVLEEKDQGKAIQIFQTVNDRGRPLTNVEKVKSLLMYYSNRFLAGELDAALSDNFGDIFEAYEEVKETAENLKISEMAKGDFTEDNIMQYHYVTLYNDYYTPTAENILGSLKKRLSEYGKNRDKEAIRKLISEYCASLTRFFKRLRALVKRAENEAGFYRLFVVLGLSVRLYPLMVLMDIKEFLESPLPSGGGHTYLDLLETLDVRVSKTAVKRDSRWMSAILMKFCEPSALEKELTTYIIRHCGDDTFRAYLARNASYNVGLPHILITYCESLSGETYGTERLKKLMSDKGGPSKEHILSQTPDFNPEAFGFSNDEEYKEYLNGIGNITLLEGNLNSGAGNRSLQEKIRVYSKSAFSMTTTLAGELAGRKSFKKTDIEERGKELIDFCVERWSV